MSDFHPIGFRLMATALAHADTRDLLPTIRVPTLLVWGDADARSPLTVAHQMHGATPGARLAVISEELRRSHRRIGRKTVLMMIGVGCVPTTKVRPASTTTRPPTRLAYCPHAATVVRAILSRTLSSRFIWRTPNTGGKVNQPGNGLRFRRPFDYRISSSV